MLRLLLQCVIPLAVTFACLAPATSARADVDISVFYDDLAPYGQWIQHSRWGWCWTPNDVPGDWRPYSTGHWAFAEECGWTWVADEPWGWAPFHYGRWLWDDGRNRWIWVPGHVWGPAWVAWRSGDGFCGWRPLPPEVGWTGSGLALGSGNLLASEFSYPHWSFCEERFFLAPNLPSHLIIPARNATIIRRTRDVTRIMVERDRIVNRSLDVRHIERVTNQRVERVTIRDVDSVQQFRELRTVQFSGEGGERAIPVFRPRIVPSAVTRAPTNGVVERRDDVAVSRAELIRRQQLDRQEALRQQQVERQTLQQQQQLQLREPLRDGQSLEQLRRDQSLERMRLQEQQRQQLDLQQRQQLQQRQTLVQQPKRTTTAPPRPPQATSPARPRTQAPVRVPAPVIRRAPQPQAEPQPPQRSQPLQPRPSMTPQGPTFRPPAARPAPSPPAQRSPQQLQPVRPGSQQQTRPPAARPPATRSPVARPPAARPARPPGRAPVKPGVP